MTDSSVARFWDDTYETRDYPSHWDYQFPSQELVAAAALQIPATIEMARQLAAEVRRVLKVGGRVFVRGASVGASEEHFTPITPESIDAHFRPNEFSRCLVLPITLVSDGGSLDARIVALQKL